MANQIQATAGLLSTIIILCTSFCISIFSLWFSKADALPRLLGWSLAPIFLFRLAALLLNGSALSNALSQFSEPLLLLLFTLAFFIRPPVKKPVLFLIPGLVPLPVLIPAAVSPAVQKSPFLPLICISASVVLSAFLLYLLKSKKDETSLIFWSAVPYLGACFCEFYKLPGVAAFAAPLLWLTACAILLIYFYRSFYSTQLEKSREIEKKLADINHSVDVEVKKRMLEIERVNQNLVNIAKTDSMSKVLNKAALLDSVEKLISSRPNSEFSIMMFDIDHFKGINDTLGHIVGDKCIKMLAATARNNVRDFDIVGRYGGDEFIIILPGTTANQALLTAERFRRRVAETDSPHYTVSIGLASYPSDGTDVKALIEAADEGLYRSKRKGRNAVSHRNFY